MEEREDRCADVGFGLICFNNIRNKLGKVSKVPDKKLICFGYFVFLCRSAAAQQRDISRLLGAEPGGAPRAAAFGIRRKELYESVVCTLYGVRSYQGSKI